MPFAQGDPAVQAAVALVGTVWPNGSTERLEAAAAHWSKLSEGIATARRTAMGSAAGMLGTMAGPMAAAATDRTRELDTGLSDLASPATSGRRTLRPRRSASSWPATPSSRRP